VRTKALGRLKSRGWTVKKVESLVCMAQIQA